ncbi:hypothetical protein ONZ45_g17065 [Pleurotus djamor]|nr:hypothetical protein ONZ45_g17065 [Pleurotus djamor]
MFPFTQGDIELPAFLDPVLDALFDRLPEPIYNLFIHFLAHALALFTALLSMLGTLLRTNPTEWDTQTILPPLITLLSAYLALVTLYRTTGWVFRTVFFFVKWGTIFAALGAAAGWYMAGAANANANGNGVGTFGLAASLGSFVLDILNGQNQNAAGGTRSRSGNSRRSKARSQKQDQRKERPKPWESFDKHRNWQFQEDNKQGGGDAGYDDAQQVIGNIVGAAAKVVKESWWEVAKNMAGATDGAPDDDGRKNKRASRSQTGRGKTR